MANTFTRSALDVWQVGAAVSVRASQAARCTWGAAAGPCMALILRDVALTTSDEVIVATATVKAIRAGPSRSVARVGVLSSKPIGARGPLHLGVVAVEGAW
jgi:hypothetical protein